MQTYSGMKTLLALGAALALSACAGGGTIAKPDVFKPTIAMLKSFNPAVGNEDGSASPLSTLQPVTAQSAFGGKLVSYEITANNGYGVETKSYFGYRTADGKIYIFDKLSNPATLGSFSPDLTMPTRHEMQPTDNGGKVLVCCANNALGSSYNDIAVDNMRFGVWANAQGQSELFVGGKVAPAADLQGVVDNGSPSATGKATYYVLAMRAGGNGEVVTSSYRPSAWGSTKTPIYSQITVNFNTQKVGGTILGNQDFGDDITLNGSLNGTKISGIATSGSLTGQFDAQLYGTQEKGWFSWSTPTPGGSEIGGVVRFNGRGDLDAVFGGKRAAMDSNSKDQTLDHLP